MIKIIGGKFKNSNLKTLDGEKTRPTRARIKEAIFSHLFSVSGTCLDLFAGSGSLSFEAFSRGCSHLVLNDINKDAIQVITDNAKHLNCPVELYQLDYRDLLVKLQGRQFDYIFIDPPYHMDCVNEIIAHVIKNNLLKHNGRMVIETHKDYIVQCDLNLYKEKIYGITKISYVKGE